ncbi:unnamed protein product [Cylicostephanus goldi]|uniref:Peptidase M13 C-terminal domain-containing protein n=1 Tax=Cylicostephanus goldi TaxID=71465 RepID=A0A3P6RRM9_CYLGO|nr:unnamed protein product [Cylicostephanus goldi]
MYFFQSLEEQHAQKRSARNTFSLLQTGVCSLNQNTKVSTLHMSHAPTKLLHRGRQAALNYGGIGGVVGHEITHGFDDDGRFYDAFGKRKEWWNEEVKKRYVQRAQCFIDQYGKIEVPGTGLNVNGELTLSENIADNGGVRLAYESASQEMCVWAYKTYLQKHGQEERIEGLEEFDNEQMFFLGWAMNWCGHRTIESLIDQVNTDPHSPARYR